MKRPTRIGGRGPRSSGDARRQDSVSISRSSSRSTLTTRTSPSSRSRANSFLRTLKAGVPFRKRRKSVHGQRLVGPGTLLQDVVRMDEVPEILDRPSRLFCGLANDLEIHTYVDQVRKTPLFDRRRLALLPRRPRGAHRVISSLHQCPRQHSFHHRTAPDNYAKTGIRCRGLLRLTVVIVKNPRQGSVVDEFEDQVRRFHAKTEPRWLTAVKLRLPGATT